MRDALVIVKVISTLRRGHLEVTIEHANASDAAPWELHKLAMERTRDLLTIAIADGPSACPRRPRGVSVQQSTPEERAHVEES